MNLIENTVGMIKEYSLISALQFLDLFRSGTPEEWEHGDKGTVVLISGFNEGMNFMRSLGNHINASGYKVIFPKSFRRFQKIETQANQILKDLEENSDGKFSIVAHSKGGLTAKTMLLKSPDTVDKVITIASPWQGSFFGHLGILNLNELKPGSETVNMLGREENANKTILNIRAGFDNHVPAGRDTLPGSREIQTDIVGHTIILFQDDIKNMVLDELEL